MTSQLIVTANHCVTGSNVGGGVPGGIGAGATVRIGRDTFNPDDTSRVVQFALPRLNRVLTNTDYENDIALLFVLPPVVDVVYPQKPRFVFTRDPASLMPQVLVASAPADLGNLTLANGYVAGIHLVSPPAAPYRAAAVVVELGSKTALESNLPDAYSWGYEVYPAEGGLIGPITTTPMITFETFLRMPYSEMSKLE